MPSTSVPKTTHAIQFFKNGGPEVIEYREVDTPTPDPKQLLVKVEWGGVNFIDTYFRRGIYPTPDFPFTVGGEGSGTILSLPTDKEVLESKDYQDRGLKVGDRVVWFDSESFIGYKAVLWTKVALLPSTVTTRIGAASFIQGLTALTFLREAYAVQKGDWILVQAAAGGVGLQLVQIATRLGAHVIGTTSTAEKAEIAKKNGAEHVILYTKESIPDRVAEITNGKGVAAIYDGVGKDTWEDNFKSIARKGTIVSLGNSSGVVPPFAPLKLSAKNLKVARPTVGNYIQEPAEFTHYTHEYFELLADGLDVAIHAEYPFSAEGVRQSQEDITGRGTVGKLLIKIA